jgi:microcystin-dependent protein
MMTFQFAPRGWALCNGQLLPINQNQALFSLLGTTYGGDGRTTFALPNLQGRTPLHVGSGYALGQPGGEVAHTLSTAELPSHGHTAQGSSANGSAISPAGGLLAQRPSQAYHAPTNLVAMMNGSLANFGGGQPHENMQPYLTVSFCIALQGIFPSQN